MMKKFFTLLFVMLVVTGCEPSKDQICIPSDPNTTQRDSQGNELTKLESIEQYLKEQKIISTIITEIKSKLMGGPGEFTSAEQIFQGLVDSPEFQNAVGAAFSLFLIIYGIAVLGGMVQVTLGDAAIRVAKLAVIATIAMNWGEFYNIVGGFFIDGMDQLIKFFLEAFGDLYYIDSSPDPTQDFVFKDLDVFVSRIFSPHSFALVSAMMSTKGTIGVAAFLGFSLIFIMWGILRVVLTYIYSIFALSLLFALAPIFITFLLFNQTKTMFDNWLNQIINYSLQPVLICAFLGLYMGLLAPFLQELLQYKLCYQPKEAASTDAGWCFVNPEDPSNQCIPSSASSEPIVSWQFAMVAFVFSWLFGANVKFAAELAAGLSPSFGSDLTKNSGAWKYLQGNNPNGAGGLLEMFKGGVKGA